MTTTTERPAARPLTIMTCFLGLATAIAATSTIAAARLRSRLDATTGQLENTRTELEIVRKELDGKNALIDARVAAVKSNVTPELVLLSVGSDDKVEKGFRFSIYRGTAFIGKVVVEKVLRDSCGCRVLFTIEGAHILAGDSAATRLQ
jgi:hypothetical protein